MPAYFWRGNVRPLFGAVVLGALVAGNSIAPAATEMLTADRVSITYETSDFARAEVHEAKARPADKFPGYEVNPASLEFCFNCGPMPEPRPLYGSVSVIPLYDRTQPEIGKAYPDLPKYIARLRHFLRDLAAHPGLERKEVPTVQMQDAGQVFLSKVRLLKFPWGRGVGFLAQYGQDMSPYAVGARLDYEIEALSNDGRFGVSAFFEVKHSTLPPTERDEVLSPYPSRAEYQVYLQRMEKLLDGKADASFVPSLTMIQQIVRSLRVTQDAKLETWNSSFQGKPAPSERVRPAQAVR